MFNYRKFENDIVQQMKMILDKWIRENTDLYIFSLDCTRGMDSIGAIANTDHYLVEQANSDSEDYWYYKYCEEEWDLFDIFEVISTSMRRYLEDNREAFTDSESQKYTEAFSKHCDKMQESCKRALIRFRQSIKECNPDIILTFNIREYLDKDERIQIFKRINSDNAIKEYLEHIDEFA